MIELLTKTLNRVGISITVLVILALIILAYKNYYEIKKLKLETKLLEKQM